MTPGVALVKSPHNTRVVTPLSSPHRPALMWTLLVLTDAAVLLTAVAISIALKFVVIGSVDIFRYVRLWPFLLVFLAVYAFLGLYSGIALSPPEELRRSTLASTLLFLLLAAITMSLRSSHELLTSTLLLSIVLTIFLLPLMRALLRQVFAKEPWWGYPAVVFGTDGSSEVVVRAMQKEPRMGLKPLAVVDNTSRGRTTIANVPSIAEEDVPIVLSQFRRGVYAVVAMPGTSQMHSLSEVERFGALFSRILIIPDLFSACSVAISPRPFGGMLGLELSQPVLRPLNRLTKRMLDLILTAGFGIVAFPLMLLIAVAVRLDSPGPVLFGHARIGKGGRIFRAWKFRSMVIDAPAVLAAHLTLNPALASEWRLNHKLKDDPRVTRVGRFLRKTSLDELPQLLNVVLGEMSLVGPRPIVQDEVHRYGEHFEIYARVPGGVTGLWQVSGRNNTSYQERVALDYLYVRNWSVWLDLCILWRTLGTVLFRVGAY